MISGMRVTPHIGNWHEYQFRAVYVRRADGLIWPDIYSNPKTDTAVGILANSPTLENPVADVYTIGDVAKVRLATNVKGGHKLFSNGTDGKLTDDVVSNAPVLCTALQDGNNDDVIYALVIGPYYRVLFEQQTHSH